MLNNVIDRVWLVLLAGTALTYWLGESGLSGSAGMTPVLVMFGLALLKGWLVILDFMELRHAPPLWRQLLTGWLALVTGLIVLAWWLASWLGSR